MAILILDLDNTLFETRSMDFSVFESAKRAIEEFTVREYGAEISKEITEQLKSNPFDLVAERYKFPHTVVQRFHEAIRSIKFDLRISTYTDYIALKALPYKKYLVSNGITHLQQAKIEALGIASDLCGIYIDDPFDKDRKYKKGHFQSILNFEQVNPEQFWVIGDTPESELKAGKELGMHTIQRLRPDAKKSPYADHAINSFEELAHLITV